MGLEYQALQQVASRHFGRVLPGHLENMYLVEALNVGYPSGNCGCSRIGRRI